MMALFEYQRPWLYPAQEQAIFCPERYAIIEASTKSGKTTGCLIWLLEQAIKAKAGRTYWWVAPIFPQAKIAYRRLKRGLSHREVYTSNESELTLTLANGAVIAFKSADTPDSLYGEDVFAAVLDEASRTREESWHALRSTLTATRGPVRLIGNVRGRKNFAYRLARKAEAGAPDWHYARITAHDAVEAGVLSADEIADAQATLPESVFRELYLAQPSDDEGNPFGIDAIAAAVAPLSRAPVTTWGIDLAKSTDWTVAIGLDASGQTACFERWQGPWEMTLRRLARLLDAGEPRTPALIDSTGVGDPITEALQKEYPSVEGFKFTAPSKQQLMEGLAVAIQQGEVAFPDGPIRRELEDFEYQYTRTGVRYAAPEGLHDDCVCALALAVRARTHAPVDLPYGWLRRDPIFVAGVLGDTRSFD
jgi:phage FluMu gp28-like protein